MRPFSKQHRVIAKADELYARGRPADAIRKLRAGVQRWPDDPHLAAALGAALIDSSLDEAEQWYAKSSELAWADPRSLPQAALGFAHIHKWAAAERVCDRIDALAPPEFEFRPEVDHVRGSILFVRGEPEAALPLLRAGFDAMPTLDHGAALVSVYVDLEMYHAAQPVIEHGLRLKPGQTYLSEIRAWMIEEGLWEPQQQ